MALDAVRRIEFIVCCNMQDLRLLYTGIRFIHVFFFGHGLYPARSGVGPGRCMETGHRTQYMLYNPTSSCCCDSCPILTWVIPKRDSSNHDHDLKQNRSDTPDGGSGEVISGRSHSVAEPAARLTSSSTRAEACGGLAASLSQARAAGVTTAAAGDRQPPLAAASAGRLSGPGTDSEGLGLVTQACLVGKPRCDSDSISHEEGAYSDRDSHGRLMTGGHDVPGRRQPGPGRPTRRL